MLREQQMLARIARRFHLPEEQLRSRLVALRREARGRHVATGDKSNAEGVPSVAEIAAWERDLFELVFVDASLLARIELEVQPGDFDSSLAGEILTACSRIAHEQGGLDFGRLMAEFDDQAVKNLLVDLAESSDQKQSSDRERWCQEVIAAVHSRQAERDRRCALATAQYNPLEAERILSEFYAQARSKNLSEYERRKK
jgi:hypothetical protein